MFFKYGNHIKRHLFVVVSNGVIFYDYASSKETDIQYWWWKQWRIYRHYFKFLSVKIYCFLGVVNIHILKNPLTFSELSFWKYIILKAGVVCCSYPITLYDCGFWTFKQTNV